MVGIDLRAATGAAWKQVAAALVCLMGFVGVGLGQGVTVPGAPEVEGGAASDHARELALPTLHVYTNLIQIPVLVLNNQRISIGRVAEDRFLVSLDSGPKFKPAHVRAEGDDPITLGILLDPSGSSLETVASLRNLVAKLAPVDLIAHDHVSVYVMSCKLMRTALDVQASRYLLQNAMDRAWTEAQRLQGRHGCQQSVGLWDAMSLAAQQMAELPGRRVMLVATSGEDHGSKVSWLDLRAYVQGKGIAVFGISGIDSGSTWGAGGGGRGIGPRGGFPAGSLSGTGGLGFGGNENLFDAICELTGGMRIYAKSMDLGYELKRLPKLLRERYIVEFPRPLKGMVGEHEIAVSINKGTLFIRPSGISVPIADPKLAADPMTLPPDATKAPEFGERRILVPKQ